ncbi:MAG: protein-ADP-ribose hydrolase [Bacteroides sp.]
MMTREEARRYAITYLLEERGETNIELPAEETAQCTLLRALINERRPLLVTAKFRSAQEIELQAQRAERGDVEWRDTLPTVDPRLRIWQGDITRLKVDAIVNAANAQLLGCFIPLHRCIDNAIHSAAGVELRLACADLISEQRHPEPTGRAKITPGFNLPARYVLHTVGPIIRTQTPSDLEREQLASCYRSCLELAAEHKLEQVAFCCISTGEFHFPNALAAEIAVNTVREYLAHNPFSSVQQIIFNVFKDDDLRIYKGLLL